MVARLATTVANNAKLQRRLDKLEQRVKVMDERRRLQQQQQQKLENDTYTMYLQEAQITER